MLSHSRSPRPSPPRRFGRVRQARPLARTTSTARRAAPPAAPTSAIGAKRPYRPASRQRSPPGGARRIPIASAHRSARTATRRPSAAPSSSPTRAQVEAAPAAAAGPAAVRPAAARPAAAGPAARALGRAAMAAAPHRARRAVAGARSAARARHGASRRSWQPSASGWRAGVLADPAKLRPTSVKKEAPPARRDHRRGARGRTDAWGGRDAPVRPIFDSYPTLQGAAMNLKVSTPTGSLSLLLSASAASAATVKGGSRHTRPWPDRRGRRGS